MGNCIRMQNFDINTYEHPIILTHIMNAFDINSEVINMLWSHYKAICVRYSTVVDDKSKNKNSMNLCEIDNILYYFGLQDTLFNRYIFRQFNSEKENQEVPFHDFVFGCWSFLGLENQETVILNYCWEILDVSGNGELKVIELMFLFGIFVHGEKLPLFIDKKMKAAFPGDALTTTNIQNIIDFFEFDASIILPFLAIHRKLRSKLGGMKFWDRLVIKRRFQHSMATSWEIINTSSEKLCYWTSFLEIQEYTGRKTPLPIINKLEMLQKEVGDAVLAKKQSEKDLLLKAKLEKKARNNRRQSEILREKHNVQQQKKKKQYIIEKAQLEASHLVRRISKRLEIAEIDEVNKIKKEKSKSEKIRKMKKRNSFSRRLSNWGNTNSGKEKGGRKGKLAVYDQVKVMDDMNMQQEDRRERSGDIKLKLKANDTYVNPNAKEIVYVSGE